MRYLPFIFLLYFAASLYAEDTKYELGRGIQVGDMPLYLGGYFSVDYEHVYKQNRKLALGELAMMAYGEYDQFSYMLELEADDVYTEVFDNEDSEVTQENFHIERLYLNYAFNENYALKVGKYNSPIGFWNRIPINVLRDTTSNPVITSLLFPKFTSGVDLRYQTESEYSLSIDTLLQEGEDLDKLLNNDVYNNFDVHRHNAIGILLEGEHVDYQFNTGYFQVSGGESYYYLLGAFKYTQKDFKLQASAGTQLDGDGKTTIPYIGYIQYAYDIQEHHEAILRVEAYKDDQFNIKDSFALIGYTYRPLYSIALKGEFQWHSLHEESKALFSFSVLF